MNSYEKQLETYLKNHGIDASIKYNDYYNRYDITFTTIIEEICISINFNDIHYDFGLVAAMITAYKQIDQQVETDWAEVDIKQISSSQILIKFEIVQVLCDTTFESPSGTNITLSITDTTMFHLEHECILTNVTRTNSRQKNCSSPLSYSNMTANF